MMPYQLSHEDASREFNWLDAREDVYTESSSSSIVKFLPALAMSDGFCRNALLSTLDVADAFLEVPQAAPRVEKNWQLVGIGDSVMPASLDKGMQPNFGISTLPMCCRRSSMQRYASSSLAC